MSYIVVEGLDFSGKSTFVNQLASRIKSRVVSEPFSESYISEVVRRTVRGATIEPVYETQLLIAGRVELFRKFNNYMEDNSSTVLISDRSFVSNMVYQSDNNGDLERILELNRQSLALYGYNIFPDVIIYIKIPFLEAASRASKRGISNALDKEVVSYSEGYRRLEAKYDAALNIIREKCEGKTTIIELDGTADQQNKDVVIEEILRIIDSKNKIPVKRLVNA